MRGISGKRWVLKYNERIPNENLIKNFGRVLSQLLVNRGLEKYIDIVLEPKLSKIPHFKNLTGIEEAVEKIKKAVDEKKRIIIYGDYDVDGITGTAILYDVLKKAGAKVYPVLPDRNTGYGLNRKLISVFEKYGDLLITVDNGTSAVEEIENSRMEVIVLDHHNVPERIPKRGTLINPKLSSEDELLKDASSSLLSFYLATALIRNFKLDIDPRIYLDIVSFGILADYMPLNPLNRIITSKGLKLLNYVLSGKLNKPGVKALLEVSGIEKEITSKDIYFYIAPRLNSAGRISKATISLNLLLEKDKRKAYEIALKLEKLNRKRKFLTNQTFNEARELAKLEENKNFIVVWKENWHPGIVGIVAGRLAGEFGKPVAVFSKNDKKAVGSIRSFGEIEVYDKVKKLSHMFIKWGGHGRAVGLTLPSEKLEVFKEEINCIFSDVHIGENSIEVDMELNPKNINEQVINQIKALEPYGEGNPYPVFLTKVEDIKRNSEYEFTVNGKKMFCWDRKLIPYLKVGKRILYSVMGNEFIIEDVENGEL